MDRGGTRRLEAPQRFNPLDRGNSNQIVQAEKGSQDYKEFQSPRSGKF